VAAEVRAFDRRQLKRLLEYAGACHDAKAVEVLLKAAKHYSDKLQPPASGQDKERHRGVTARAHGPTP